MELRAGDGCRRACSARDRQRLRALRLGGRLRGDAVDGARGRGVRGAAADVARTACAPGAGPAAPAIEVVAEQVAVHAGRATGCAVEAEGDRACPPHSAGPPPAFRWKLSREGRVRRAVVGRQRQTRRSAPSRRRPDRPRGPPSLAREQRPCPGRRGDPQPPRPVTVGRTEPHVTPPTLSESQSEIVELLQEIRPRAAREATARG